MSEDLRKKIQAIRQNYAEDLDSLINDLREGRISGDEYRTRASDLRAKYFDEDKSAHAELREFYTRRPRDPSSS